MPDVSLRDLASGRGAPVWDAAPGTRPALTVVDLDAGGVRDAGLLGAACAALAEGGPGVVVGVSRTPLPDVAAPLLAELAVTCAPGGPGRTWVDRPAHEVVAGVAQAPLAAAVLVQHLRSTAGAPVEQALVAESACYSALQAGPEFRAWATGRPSRRPGAPTPVTVAREGAVLQVTLDGPDRHNAYGAATREALLDALAVAEADPTVETVDLRGAGPSFCSGGDLDEFGTAPDPVSAHLLRTGRSVARSVHRLRHRVRPVLHGACIGAGIELPSFADHVLARPGTSFQLPELGMGLVPGAGGTVGITARVGRWRCAWLALTGLPIDVDTALRWGLVDGRA